MALTRWPRASITARSVCTNASRAPGPPSGRSARAIAWSCDAEPRAALAQRDARAVEPARDARSASRARSARDAPGSATQRSSGLTSRPEAAAGDQREPLDPLAGTARRTPSRRRRRASARRSSRARSRAPTAGRGSPPRARRASSRRAASPSRRGRSGRARSPCGARRGASRPRCQCREELTIPCTSTTGGPAARRSGRRPGGRGARSPRPRTRGLGTLDARLDGP